MPEDNPVPPLLRERLAELGRRLTGQLAEPTARRYLLEFETLLAAAASRMGEEREVLQAFLSAAQEQLDDSRDSATRLQALFEQSDQEQSAFDGQLKVSVSGMREELLAAQCSPVLEEALQRALVSLEGNQSALRNHQLAREKEIRATLDNLLACLDQLTSGAETQLARIAQSEEAMQVDGLTGLPNHERLLSQVGKACLLALREDHALSLIAIDADGLDAINKQHGVSAGDRVLCSIASLITESIRSSDFAARGLRDCFFVVLSATTLQQAAGIADKIRLAVQDRGAVGPAHCTVSCGAACYWEYDTPPHLVQRAVQAMAQARAGGGNCVRRFGES